jgi:hypothetical protein
MDLQVTITSLRLKKNRREEDHQLEKSSEYSNLRGKDMLATL